MGVNGTWFLTFVGNVFAVNVNSNFSRVGEQFITLSAGKEGKLRAPLGEAD